MRSIDESKNFYLFFDPVCSGAQVLSVAQERDASAVVVLQNTLNPNFSPRK